MSPCWLFFFFFLYLVYCLSLLCEGRDLPILEVDEVNEKFRGSSCLNRYYTIGTNPSATYQK